MNFDHWQTLGHHLVKNLQDNEMLSLSLSGEDTLFTRLNQGKVRQNLQVQQSNVEINFFKNKRNVKLVLPWVSNSPPNMEKFLIGLQTCRDEIENVVENPYTVFPQKSDPYHRQRSNKVDRFLMLENCLEKIQGQDFVGLFSAGEMIRANFNSMGVNQWFETSSFALDFSLYTPNQQAVKGIYGSLEWDDKIFNDLLQEKHQQLEYLNFSIREIPRGKYRVYLAPAAVKELLSVLSWQGVSQGAYQRGHCGLKKLVDGKKGLSSKFSLQENFTTGEMPLFNEKGEISAEIIPLIIQGQHQNLLCSSRTAQEYGLVSNYAASAENLRSPEILSGNLSSDTIIKELGTGIFISNLHYLNWSDVREGRVTGMTRFGCFWVENGHIIAPIQDMRFDETLYHFWGDGLEELTNQVYTFPDTNTYFQRNLGTSKTPGMIVNDFTFVG